MRKIGRYFVVFVIVSLLLLSLIGFLRFYALGSIPQGLTKDEAYYGYDAYSIMQTGQDIWGERYPLRFKSTGEYKLNLTYLIIPAIKVLDLSETAVRTPSAVLGFLTLPLLFFTFRLLSVPGWLSLLLTSIFALSPWSFGMSRLFYESNAGLFFIALGLYGLLYQRHQSSKVFAYLAPISLALSAYLYGPYLYIATCVIVLEMITAKRISKSWLIFLLTLSPLLLSLSGGGGLTRLTQEWSLKAPGYAMATDEARMNCYLSFGKSHSLAKICYPLWNKPLNQLLDTSLVFLRTLSPEYLFYSGVNEYILPSRVGAYPISLTPLYLLFILALPSLLSRPSPARSNYLFLLSVLLTSVAIISLAGRVELYRNPVGLYLIFIFLGLGANWALKYLHAWPKWLMLTCLALYFSVVALEQTRYLIDYFTNYTRNNPLVFSSDAKEVYDYLSKKREYTYLVDRKFHGPIYAAFFWKLDPDYFRENVVWTEPDPWGWINAKSIGNVYSTQFTLQELYCAKADDPEFPIKALVVSDPEPRFDLFPAYKTYDSNGVLRLHDIYDIDHLYTNLKMTENCQ